MAAMRAEDYVIRFEMGTHSDGDRFLSHVGMTGAVNQTPLMGAGQLFLASADEHHLPIKGQQLNLVEFRRRFRPHGRCFLAYANCKVPSQDFDPFEGRVQLKCLKGGNTRPPANER
jgi:hypothetical protein